MWGGMKSIERDGDPGELVGLMPPPPYPPPYPLTHYMLCLGVLIEGARRGSCSFVLSVRCVPWYKANTRVVVNP